MVEGISLINGKYEKVGSELSTGSFGTAFKVRCNGEYFIVKKSLRPEPKEKN